MNNQIENLFSQLADIKLYNRWLCKKLPIFNMRTPQELIDDGRGQEVEKELQRLINIGANNWHQKPTHLRSKGNEEQEAGDFESVEEVNK